MPVLRRRDAVVVTLAFFLTTTSLAAKPKAPRAPKPTPRPAVLAFTLGDRTALRSLSEHASDIDLLSPQSFAAHPDGQLTGRVPPEVAAAAHGRLAMMPSVVNADFSVDALSTLLESRASRRRLAQALVATAQRQHLRGFVIDFEGLSRAQRQRYVAFLAEIRTRFHAAGLRLGVAVPAPVGSFRDAFDYRAIGLAADMVVLMAYDQHSRSSEPGPIAGYNWVERVVADTVAAIPPAKLLLGLPLYHRSWTEISGFRDSTAGSHGQALSLLNEFGGELQWDPLSRSPWFRIENLGTESTARESKALALDGARESKALALDGARESKAPALDGARESKAPALDGASDVTSDGATHTVWLEDSRSAAEKIELARRYRLAGVAAWRLGQEDPGIWGVFENYRGVKTAPVAQPRHRRAATQSRAALSRR